MDLSAAAALAGEPVVVAYLFGSRARGDARPDSDVDVAVLLADTVPRGEYVDRSLAYAGRLEAALRLPVSPVVVLNEAPLRLQGRVLRDGHVLFVGDEAARVRYEAATRVQALDYEIKAVELDRRLLAAHARGQR